MKIKLPFNFTPRPYQLPFLKRMDAGCLRAVKVWHRRAGKEKTDLNLMIKKSQERIGTYFYGFPQLNQGRKILWEGTDKDGLRFLDHFPKEIIVGKPNDTDMKIRFKNGSLFQIVGSDKYNSLVGTNPIGIVFSEYSLQDPIMWGFFRPILAENGGWVIFNFTPRGENHAKDIYDLAKSDPVNWFSEILTVNDTHAINKEVLEQERRECIRLYGNDSLYQQEYFCDFSVPIIGAYYADEIIDMNKEKRICSVLHDSDFAVNTWWDLGVNDKMAIWFEQTIGNEIRLIDYEEGVGKGLDYYIKLIQNKPYIFASHNAPHDIKVRELSSGKTRLEIAEKLGIKFKVVPNIPIADGINAVRSILKKCYIDSVKCASGINALKNYHKEYDDIRKTYNDRPYHDWSSNGADAFRMMAVGKSNIIVTKEQGKIIRENKNSNWQNGNYVPKTFFQKQYEEERIYSNR